MSNPGGRLRQFHLLASPAGNSGRKRTRRTRQHETLEGRALLAGDLVAQWVADDLTTQVADGGTVDAWVDRVGGISAMRAGNPVLIESALSGRAVVRFDAGDGGDSLRVPGSSSPMTGVGDYSVSVAFRTDSQTLANGTTDWFKASGLVDANRLGWAKDWGISINQNGQILTGMGIQIFAPSNSVQSAETGLNDGQLQVVTVTRHAGEVAIHVNGGAPTIMTGADGAPRESIDLVIGELQTGGNPFTGEIAEVRIYNGQLSASEVAAVHGEITAFYDNVAPVAANDAYTLTEDPSFGIFQVLKADGVLSNDFDAESNSMTARLISGTQHGTVGLTPDGSFVYSPARDFFGTDSFTYVAYDGQDSNVATVTLNVTPAYDPATAVADTYKAHPLQTLNVPAATGLLANDVNPDQVHLEAMLAQNVNFGSLTLANDGSFQFDPQGHAGVATFSYRVNDSTQLSAPATVSIIVNTPPVAQPDNVTVIEDTPLVRNSQNGLLANDQDADGNALTVTVLDLPQQGEFTWQADGSFTYTPNSNFFGGDQFTYRVSDGEDASEVATVTLTVQAVNDAPVGSTDSYFRPLAQPFDVQAGVGLLANDFDIDSATLTALLAAGPDHGTLQLRPDGSFVYTPDAGFEGTDRFTYRASDGQAQSDPTEVLLLVGAPPVRINEILAANATGLETRIRESAGTSFRGDRLTPDWIELMNLTSADLDLGGFHLTDNPDEPLKWEFPAGTIIPASGYLIVYADRLNVTDPALDETGRLHTNFKLDVTGESLAITSVTGEVLDEVSVYPAQRADISYGLTPTGELGHLLSVTPGAANSGRYAGVVADPEITVPRGFYYEPFVVEVTAPEGSVIRYTLDGSEPTADHGEVYAGPLKITTTTVVKAAAFRDDYVPSVVDVASYIFPADVLLQDQTGLEGAVRWGHAGPDWEMDPLIVNHENPELRPVVEDLLRLPTVSLSVDVSEFFGSGGIYIRGENIEKPVGFEYFDPNSGDAGIQTNSTIQIVGGSSPQRWKSDKLSMRVRFTEDEGASELNYPLFGSGAAVAFDTLVLDARLNNVWHYGGGSEPAGQRGRAQYMRDEFASDLQNAVGGYGTHGQHVHVYINGIYWGMHMLHERPDENFAASYLGGNAEDYDMIKHQYTQVVNGSNASFVELMDRLGTSGDLSDEDYQAASQLLDVPDFINYMLVNYYGGNQDWDHQNWYASHSRLDGLWRFHSWDAEKVLQDVRADVTTTHNANSPTAIQRRLMTNPEYALQFADAVQKHFYHGGAMTPEAAAALYVQRSDQIDLVMRLESARWGDNQFNSGRIRYTRQHWVDNRNDLLDNYFPQRTQNVLDQFARRRWFQPGQAVEFAVNGLPQHGGSVTPGAALSFSAEAEGTMYYTTDGSDPRRPGGELAPSALAYQTAIPLQSATPINARVQLADGSWGPLSAAQFTVGVPADATNLRISELNYHPGDLTPAERAAGITDSDEFEFIELLNIANVPVDLSLVRFQQVVNGNQIEGVQFDFADGSVRELLPGERVVVVENMEAFPVRYGSGIPVAGEWSGGLNNSSERVVLVAGDVTLADFSYSDRWHTTTDGDGYTLQAIDEAGDPTLLGTGTAWRPSSQLGGSPGRPDDTQAPLTGDSNHDGKFDSGDLVLVFQAGKYEDGIAQNATFEEGDWDGDRDFTTADLVLAFQQGNYVAEATPAATASLFDGGTAKSQLAVAVDPWKQRTWTPYSPNSASVAAGGEPSAATKASDLSRPRER